MLYTCIWSKGQKSMKSIKFYQDLQARCSVGIEARGLESWEERLLWTEVKVMVKHLDEESCGQLAILD